MIFPKNLHQLLNMNNKTKNALILLAKYPEGENVKTRLAAAIGQERANQYYRKWLKHNLSMAAKLPLHIDIFLRLAERQHVEKMQEMLNDLRLSSRIKCMQPTADNITDNLKDAFLDLYKNGYDKMVSAATDTNFSVRFFPELFSVLDDQDVVMGIDQKREGINAFGLHRRVASFGLIRQLFESDTRGMNPQTWVKQVIRSQETKFRVLVIPGVIDVDDWNDLRLISDH